MRRSSLLGHAVEVLDLFLTTRRPADIIVQDFFRARHYLGSRDRRFIADTVFDILRHFAYLHTIAGAAVRHLGVTFPGGTSSPMALLPVYLCLIQKEESAAIIPAMDGLWRSFVRTPPLDGFLAAAQESAATLALPPDPAERLALLYSLPRFVTEDWVSRFGEEEAGQLCKASNTQAPVTIRVNTLKCTVEECRAALRREGVESTPTRLSPTGLVLAKRVNVSGLQTFRNGWFEMQDEGSQLLSYLVHPVPGSRVVDACAGGGGKTLHLAALMRNSGEIHAMDVSRDRLRNLRERTGRAGAAIVRSFIVDGERIAQLKEKADAVLIDAPCTGTGTFRRNPGAKILVDQEMLESLVRTQERLLDRYSAMVRPGGTLVYATCSLLKREDEDQVERFLAGHPQFSLEPVPGVLEQEHIAMPEAGPMLHLMPNRDGTDGFFAAVMKRKGETENREQMPGTGG